MVDTDRAPNSCYPTPLIISAAPRAVRKKDDPLCEPRR